MIVKLSVKSKEPQLIPKVAQISFIRMLLSDNINNCLFPFLSKILSGNPELSILSCNHDNIDNCVEVFASHETFNGSSIVLSKISSVRLYVSTKRTRDRKYYSEWHSRIISDRSANSIERILSVTGDLCGTLRGERNNLLRNE